MYALLLLLTGIVGHLKVLEVGWYNVLLVLANYFVNYYNVIL